MSWTDERIELLEQLWAEGLSASAIARKLGGFEHCNDGGRSAVIGKVHRLRLPGRETTISARNSPRAVGAPAERGYRVDKIRKARAKALAPVEPKPDRRATPSTTPRLKVTEQHKVIEVFDATEITELPPDQSDCAVTFMQAKPDHCRFPIGDTSNLETFRFCGAPKIPECPYCRRHAALCFNNTKGRRRRTPEEEEIARRKGRAAIKASVKTPEAA